MNRLLILLGILLLGGCDAKRDCEEACDILYNRAGVGLIDGEALVPFYQCVPRYCAQAQRALSDLEDELCSSGDDG